MRKLVLTPKFKRSYRKYVARNRLLQQRMEDVLRSIQQDVFAPGLGSHKLSGVLAGYWHVPAGTIAELSSPLRSMPSQGRRW